MGIGDSKFCSRLPGNQQDFVTIYVFCRASEEDVNRARAVGEGTQTATSARTGCFGSGSHRALERFSLVGRTRHQNAPPHLLHTTLTQPLPPALTTHLA